VLLWNVVPTHPHRSGVPLSNRRPTAAEIAEGLPFVERVAVGRRVLGVGRIAQHALGVPYVRHPSHGGAAIFRAGLAETLLG
jgi:uracil-DNA glycosylase